MWKGVIGESSDLMGKLKKGTLTGDDLGDAAKKVWDGFQANVVAGGTKNLGGLGQAIRANSRQAINKHEVMMFQGLPFRSFDFQWDLAPRSQQDATNIIEFINEIKLGSAPSLQEGDNWWTYPDEFSITINIEGQGPILLARKMVCTNVTINHTPHGFWSQLSDGFPTMINIGLSFIEAEYASKELLKSKVIV